MTDLKRQQMLHYLLGKIFGENITQEELDAITGKPEPHVPMQTHYGEPTPVRFQLKE